jgi:hypothetical protein
MRKFINIKTLMLGVTIAAACVLTVQTVRAQKQGNYNYANDLQTDKLFNLGIQTGTLVSTADGTVTNTFTQPYTNIPNVICTGYGTTPTNWITSITPSNFVWNAGKLNATNNWIAIGKAY